MSAVIPRSFFVGAKRALLPEIPQVFGATAPHIATDAESWLASLPSDEQARVSPLLRNAVKKCGQCAKPNAFTLKTCNSCGQSIEATPTTFTTNVFTCFVLGIAKGPFPLSISIRRQTKDVIVLDDLLALSPLHLNAIPASQYMPDWRYLLTRPAEGLPLLRSLLEECHTAAEEHFLSRPEWCAAAIKGGVLSREAFMAGFNYPPSQYQLHVQFIAPMLLPFQRYQYERGTHYTFGRFFPVAYAERCLEALLAANERLSADWLNKDIEALVDHLKTKYGVDYEAMHRAAYTKTGSDYHTYANWSADQFQGTATEQPDGTLVFTPNDSSVDATALDVTAQVNKDKTELQNYGRPYDANGKPTGSFYSFPKRVDELLVWSA